MGIKMPPLLLFFASLIALQQLGTDSIILPGSMPSLHPLCASQFRLANYACSNLPLSPLLGASTVALPLDPFPDSNYAVSDSDNSPSDSHHHSPSHSGGHHSPPSHGGHHSPSSHSGDDDHGQGHRGNWSDNGHDEHRHRRDHENRHEHESRHEHEHRHRHGHGHGHHTQEDECCRWLKQIDPQCVCEVLVHLPTFLSRPNHIYTAVVGDTCNVTYACGGRLRP